MESQPLSIACSLTDAELQLRRSEVLSEVKAAVTATKETETGFVFEFAMGNERIASLAKLVELERQCCPFLTFRITVEPGAHPIELELSGPPGTKEFLKTLFA